ncbi:MAG: hypothetical protein FJ088_08600 [Deltaproteobacteria bacterium]|nr:hypothetical protein [Deltaproteobacteria bacterium]
MRFFLKGISAIVAAAFIFSCGGSSKGADSSIDQDAVEIADKDGSEVFYDIMGEEIAGKECEKDEDCAGYGEKFACNCKGECAEAKCKTNNNCGSDKFCDPCDKFCYDLRKLCEPCDADYQCEGADNEQYPTFCLEYMTGGKFCGHWCPSGGICPKAGFVCTELEGYPTNQCIPQTGNCETLEQCKTDFDCEFGQICNKDKGLCAKGCSDDFECPQEPEKLVCSSGHCMPPCDDALSPCEEGWECKNGHCKITGGCASAYDCIEPETYCNPETKMCAPGCIIDFDCKSSAKMCSGGVCVKKGCKGNYQCAFEEVCKQDTGECLNVDIVDPDNKLCEPCDPQKENSCGSEDILCITFQDENGQEKGSYCAPPCYPDPENECPQGYECNEIKDDQGKSYGKKCLRFCYQKPVGI